ncbi:MAG: methyltransferase domain-containing protein [Bryobacteraceae bacterium]
MDIRGWDRRYRSKERLSEDFDAPPTPLLIQTAQRLKAGKALDLACGTGRNALWLAKHGWSVAAVDASPAAIDTLRTRASQNGLKVDAQEAELERGQYMIKPSAWDLIAMCYYFQRDLFEPAKQGIVPGGVLLAIIHIIEPGEEPTHTRARPGELRTYFDGWNILHYYEGKPNDTAHRRSVAEIVARRPL